MIGLFKKLRFKKLFLLTAIYLAVGLAGGLFFYYVLPDHYFRQYYFIVLFFWLAGVVTSCIIDRTSHQEEFKKFTIHMVMRVAKFLLTIIFLVIFEKLIIEAGKKLSFAIALMSNYLLYTSLELYKYHAYNKQSIKHARKE